MKPQAMAIIVALHLAAIYGLATSTVVRQAHSTLRAVLILPEIELPRLPPPPPPKPPTAQKASRAPDPLPQRAIDAPPTPNIVTSTTDQLPVPIVIQAPAPTAWPVAAVNLAPAPASPPPIKPAKIELPSSDAQYLNNPTPIYPPVSKRMNEQGNVVLRVLVSPEGVAQQIELKTSSGYERLDNAAIKAVNQWRFVPGKRNGQAEAMWFNVPINFELS